MNKRASKADVNRHLDHINRRAKQLYEAMASAEIFDPDFVEFNSADEIIDFATNYFDAINSWRPTKEPVHAN